MPIVHITLSSTLEGSFRQAVVEGVHAALVHALHIPEDDRFHLVHALPPEALERPAGRSERFVLVEITMFPGRSDAAKARLFEEIVARLSRDPGVPPSDVFIVCHEPPMAAWSPRDGRSAAALPPRFRVEVE